MAKQKTTESYPMESWLILLEIPVLEAILQCVVLFVHNFLNHSRYRYRDVYCIRRERERERERDTSLYPNQS